MKKLMFAAAVAAMAMGAQATTILDVYAMFAKGVSEADCKLYTKAYIVSKAVSETWDGTVAGIESLKPYVFSSPDFVFDGYYDTFSSGPYMNFFYAGNSESLYNEIIDIGADNLVTIVASESLDDAFIVDYNYSTSDNGIEVYFENENPHSVPEPTSALLMLLGMAGLALKRKVA